jgi:hypothetical protein
VVTFTSTGDVSEFDAADRAAVKTGVANEALVPESAVTVTVEAGSVLVTTTIATTSPAQAATISSRLSASLSTPAAATSALGVPVTSTPSVTGGASDNAPDNDGLGSGGGGRGITTMIVAAAGGGAALAAGLGAIAMYCRKKKRGLKVTPSSGDLPTSSVDRYSEPTHVATSEPPVVVSDLC